ncbi:unnamed protein product [Paramecium pentaurelia]|uniref:Dyp-type peroxidase n=1 Tax=Paramecium pentaurelia TaxID=43138 RepID=A0A8S1SE55_9CILI|nr:unnamed protein product [Paramecium pentaurelia]
MRLARFGIPTILKRLPFTQLYKFKPNVVKSVALGTLFAGLTWKQALRLDEFQSTVVSDVNEFCCVLVLELTEGDANLQHEALNALKEVPKLVQKKSNEDDELDPVTVGVGFQTKFWEKLTRTPQSDYDARAGTYGSMPYGKGNVIVHVKAQNRSLAFETVQKVVRSLPKGSYRVVSERYGYKYQDGRDMSGFLDGTMNPSLKQQRQKVAVNERGGSYMIHQIWHHKLDWLDKVTEEDQEKMVGRKKSNSFELRPLPIDSHVTRTRSEDNKRLLIVRQSQPFGTVTGDHGLLFIAYAKDLNNFNTMLDRMTGKGDGINDQIMKMSINSYGNYFYVPSVQELQRL